VSNSQYIDHVHFVSFPHSSSHPAIIGKNTTTAGTEINPAAEEQHLGVTLLLLFQTIVGNTAIFQCAV